MLSSSEPLVELKDRLRKIGPQYVAQIRPAMAVDYWRIFRGKALYSQIVLEDFFRDLLCPTKDRRVEDLRLPTAMYFTDLYSLDARTSPLDEGYPNRPGEIMSGADSLFWLCV
jgi:hypothetical protein